VGLGGAHIAFMPDTLMPVFVNNGNPASYSRLRYTSLEVGGNYYYSIFSSPSSTLKKWNTNFSYATLGVPLRSKGGFALGIMPYSSTGYQVQEYQEENNIGEVKYLYNGTGGLTRAFTGFGLAPFNQRLSRFRKKHLYVADSLKRLGKFEYKLRESVNKLLSDFNAGFNVNYIFGDIEHNTRVQYPNSVLYSNSYRTRSVTLGDFTGNFGLQTAFTVDSAYSRKRKMKVAMREKVKFTFGYFMGLNNTLHVNYNSAGYNYILNAFGEEVLRDTIYYDQEAKGTIQLPLEQGFGIGFKKGEKINIVADFAVTSWSAFRYLDSKNNFSDNYRASIGFNYVPEKYAAGSGAFWRRMQYRFGATYNTGYINLSNTSNKTVLVSNYAVSAGLGIPVGIDRRSSMVNVALQYGRLGPADKNYLMENYFRVYFGFTFNDRWFRKFRYD
jgi:hypothetical protein